VGSVGEHLKGETPFLERIKEHNRKHARMIALCVADAPLWMKMANKLGWSLPLYEWQAKNQYKYWEEEETSDGR
jgi:hypothetical protein